MNFKHLLAAIALTTLALACSDDDDGGSSRRTYCFNGTGYTCGDQASYDKCTSNKDCSGCTRDDSVCK
ncbi:MAG: hypothetical protein MUF64_11820 [Polyangiaceae bacterium]|nr:hypothetical protein [Polyangiaceae bacterium]